MKRPPMVLVPIVVLAVAAAGAVLRWNRRTAEEDARGVAASGTVEATQSDLGFQLPGRIASVIPREGEEVGAGQEVATLEQSELEARVAAAAAQLDAAEARLRELEAGSRPEEVSSAAAAVALLLRTRSGSALGDPAG